MAVSSGPKITKDGLVLYLDAANFESFRGEPTTNLKGTLLSSSITPSQNYTLTTRTWLNNISVPQEVPLDRALLIRMDTGGINDKQWYWINQGDYQGKTITFSWWVKSLSGDANDTICIAEGGYSSGYTQTSYVATSEWKKVSVTRTINTTNSITLGSGPNAFVLDKSIIYTGFQLEEKSYPTRFTLSTRGTTVATGGGWADMTNNGNHAEFIGNVNYISDDNGSLYFPTGSDYARVYYPSSNFVNTNYTWCAWVLGKHSRAGGITHNMPDIGYGSFGWSRLGFRESLSNGKWQWMAYKSTGPPDYSLLNICDSSDSDWIFLSVTADYTNNFIKVYSNGEYKDSSAYVDTSGNGGYFGIGKGYGTYSGWNEDFQGKISNVMVFNRALSQAEIRKNYEATRARYGL